MLKPIETRYRGYRFRSRLEARWAVFFDAMEIPWEYEVAGFRLPSRMYMPDFYLPSLRAWAEVKPVADLLDVQAAREVTIAPSVRAAQESRQCCAMASRGARHCENDGT